MTGPAAVPDGRAFRILVKWRLRCALNSVFKRGASKRTSKRSLAFAALFLTAYAILFALLLRPYFAESAHARSAASAAFGGVALFLFTRAFQFALQSSSDRASLQILAPLPIRAAALRNSLVLETLIDLFRVAPLIAGPVVLAFALAHPPNPIQALAYLIGWLSVCVGGACAGTAAALLTHSRRSSSGALANLLNLLLALALGGGLLLLAVEGAGYADDSAALLSAWKPYLERSPSVWLADALLRPLPLLQLALSLALSGAVVFISLRVHSRRFNLESLLGSRPARAKRRRSKTGRSAPLAALLIKETRVIVRNPAMLAAWTLPFLLFTAMSAWTPLPLERRNMLAVSMMSGYGAAVIGVILPSAEGRSITLLRLALPRLNAWVAAKAIAAAAFIAVPSLAAVALNSKGVPPLRWTLIPLGAAAGSGLFSVGIGCLMPRFDEPNPMRAARPQSFVLAGLYYLGLTVGLHIFSEWTAALCCVAGAAAAAAGSKRLQRADDPF